MIESFGHIFLIKEEGESDTGSLQRKRNGLQKQRKKLAEPAENYFQNYKKIERLDTQIAELNRKINTRQRLELAEENEGED